MFRCKFAHLFVLIWFSFFIAVREAGCPKNNTHRCRVRNSKSRGSPFSMEAPVFTKSVPKWIPKGIQKPYKSIKKQIKSVHKSAQKAHFENMQHDTTHNVNRVDSFYVVRFFGDIFSVLVCLHLSSPCWWQKVLKYYKKYQTNHWDLRKVVNESHWQLWSLDCFGVVVGLGFASGVCCCLSI